MHLIDVVPPRPPVLTGVYAATAVTLRWAANREPDLALYRLYRTGDQAAPRTTAMPLVAAFLLDPATGTDTGTGTGAVTDATDSRRDRALSASNDVLSYSDTGFPAL